MTFARRRGGALLDVRSIFSTKRDGSNAASGWVVRVQRGNRVLDAAGNWRHINSHNPRSPYYDPASAIATHVPIQAPDTP